ncbi:hypothetical protein FNH09_40560 [Streptomyces adustus]|uniref:Uncharacterized protein n=1 Tax=Streptomyces adustus TaxID=1609272 RepID=A0A5N8VQJ1_9ACTN|nr:hypothetical protein [Streptomyces adustus]
MNSLTGFAALLVALVLLAGPALAWLLRERRIDRELRPRQAQKSSSRSTVPSTATWYADGRRSKKLVSS